MKGNTQAFSSRLKPRAKHHTAITSRRIASMRVHLLRWYRSHGRSFIWRDNEASMYLRIVSEVLLQRTRAPVVDSMLSSFQSTFPSWKALGSARRAELEKVLRPLGLWRRRAATLIQLGRQMPHRLRSLPRERAELEAMPGVGQYVASAILLFVHGNPEPLLDTNMARVLERCFGRRRLADIRHDPYLQDLARRIVAGSDPIRINWAILDLGALVCTPRSPRCRDCPLRRQCQFYRHR
jgi:A/G-specific adenine glycosylase